VRRYEAASGAPAVLIETCEAFDVCWRRAGRSMQRRSRVRTDPKPDPEAYPRQYEASEAMPASACGCLYRMVAVALANKTARIAFAILRGKTVYREIPA
jgi:hypothetical protein